MKFSIEDFFSKCDQIRCFLRVWPHLLKKSLMRNFIYRAQLRAVTCKSLNSVHYFKYLYHGNIVAKYWEISKRFLGGICCGSCLYFMKPISFCKDKGPENSRKFVSIFAKSCKVTFVGFQSFLVRTPYEKFRCLMAFSYEYRIIAKFCWSLLIFQCRICQTTSLDQGFWSSDWLRLNFLVTQVTNVLRLAMKMYAN